MSVKRIKRFLRKPSVLYTLICFVYKSSGFMLPFVFSCNFIIPCSGMLAAFHKRFIRIGPILGIDLVIILVHERKLALQGQAEERYLLS